MRKTKAVILVGGPGMRLRPLTDDRPKPVVPVLNRPFLEHTIAHLKRFGINDIILAMSYLPDKISEYFGNGEVCGVRLIYCLEKEPLGTAGAVKNAASYLDCPFIVLNGDNVFIEMDWEDVLAFHRAKKAKVTIFLTHVDNPSAYGVVETDSEGRVRRFIEKPPTNTETTNWINAGGYIMEPEVLKDIPANTHYMFENGLFPTLLEMGDLIYGYPYLGYWLDMGTPKKYFSLNRDILKQKVKSPLIAATGSIIDGVHYGADVSLHPEAVVTSPIIIDSCCRIGKGVCLTGPVVIGQNCRLDDGAVVENSILWDNVTVGTNARLVNCIVSNQVVIDSKCEIRNSIVTSSSTVLLL